MPPVATVSVYAPVVISLIVAPSGVVECAVTATPPSGLGPVDRAEPTRRRGGHRAFHDTARCDDERYDDRRIHAHGGDRWHGAQRLPRGQQGRNGYGDDVPHELRVP